MIGDSCYRRIMQIDEVRAQSYRKGSERHPKRRFAISFLAFVSFNFVFIYFIFSKCHPEVGAFNFSPNRIGFLIHTLVHRI